jgi:hypothetical protein
VTNIHALLGAAVLALFLLATILNAIGLAGREIRAARYVSYLGALALLVQYLLGIGLLASGHGQAWYHYVLALLVVVPVGLEHGLVRRRLTGQSRALGLTLATLAATVLVVLAYLVGQRVL